MKIGSYGYTSEKARGKAPWRIYYNGDCGTCRSTLDLLRSKGVDPAVVEYLGEPLKEPELRDLLSLLKVPAKELLRTKEKIFSTLSINLDNADEVIRALAEHPVLLQRPIVVHGHKAVIARPPEKALEIID